MKNLHSSFREVSPQMAAKIISGRNHHPWGPCACACKPCRTAESSWPRYYVGSAPRRVGTADRGDWLSYDCHLERADLPASEPYHIRHDERWACEEGLTVKVHRTRRAAVPDRLVGGCLLCGGLRRKGERYCLNCWAYAGPVERVTGEPATNYLDPEAPDAWAGVRDEMLRAA